jgi:hypothetical protein
LHLRPSWTAERQRSSLDCYTTACAAFAALLQLREAAWLAAGQHGFEALAGLPELTQIVQRCASAAMDAVSGQAKLDQTVSDKELYKRLSSDEESLISLLTPQLRVCLLAEVAAGLLVPG